MRAPNLLRFSATSILFNLSLGTLCILSGYGYVGLWTSVSIFALLQSVEDTLKMVQDLS